MDGTVKVDELKIDELNHTEQELLALYRSLDVGDKDRERLRRWTVRKFTEMRELLLVRGALRRTLKNGRI